MFHQKKVQVFRKAVTFILEIFVEKYPAEID